VPHAERVAVESSQITELATEGAERCVVCRVVNIAPFIHGQLEWEHLHE